MPNHRSSQEKPLVWIVDDSPTEAAITERSLGGERFVFEKFGDGSTVVERIAEVPKLPDLLLLDWVMPGMTGDQVCRFLRTRPETADLPIIMVTASRIDTSDIVAGLASGANDYVPRPFAPEELRARVEVALRTKQLSDLAKRERQRLTTINQVGHSLLQGMTTAEAIADELARVLTVGMCDGCSVLILPGLLPELAVTRHRHRAGAEVLAKMAAVADPVIHKFRSSAEAREKLPAAYTQYIERFGLRGLAILPFPSRDPIVGVVTVTRDNGTEPFDADDIATIETCIEYASLAMESVVRFDAERVANAQRDAVLQGLPIGIFAADAAGVLTLVNAAARALVPAAGTARTLDELFQPAQWRASDGSPIADAHEMLGSGPIRLPVATDLVLRTSDGPPAGERMIAVSAVPLRDGHDSVVGSVTVLEDVTAERTIAAERERTARFQEEMLAIVGHDLRSPLGAVLTATELLAMGLAGETSQMRTVQRIANSAHRMTRIIEQLLDVTHVRLGAGIPVELQHVSLGPLVGNVIDELALAYPRTKFERQGSTEIEGTWDPDRLTQVISNLASNAAQYGRAGEPVTIGLARQGVVAEITVHNVVRDEPIPEEAIAQLFQPYRRGTAAGHASGLGLGLYIVRAIVQAHHGSIQVESTAAGTTFRVLLPIR